MKLYLASGHLHVGLLDVRKNNQPAPFLARPYSAHKKEIQFLHSLHMKSASNVYNFLLLMAVVYGTGITTHWISCLSAPVFQ
jgi:hypothetical protein